MDDLNSRMNRTKERINKLEDNNRNYPIWKIDIDFFLNKLNLRDLQDDNKIFMSSRPGQRGEKGRAEKVFLK